MPYTRATIRPRPLAATLAFLALAPLAACSNGARALPEEVLPPTEETAAAVAAVGAEAVPLTGAPGDYDRLIAAIGDARFVLLGEQTHGTHEFYRERMRITQRLVAEKGFNALALEADWPDAHRVHRWVRGTGTDATAEQALSSFTRFPRWMWRNAEFRDMAAWLRTHNMAASERDRVGVYGMDLYSAFAGIDAVYHYLDRVDAAAAARAREAYRCLEPYRTDAERYGRDVATGAASSCEASATRVFDEMEARADDHARRTGGDGVLGAAEDELLLAHQSARIVKNAEAYYRLGVQGASSWNLRDQHMAESLNELTSLLDSLTGRPTKIVVWAHNTHAGDARVTEMGEQGGELNVGQLMRQGHAERSFLVGFTTYHGSVLAARAWGSPGERRTLRPALPGSYSALFHEASPRDFLLMLRGGGEAARRLEGPRLQRAVGVVYVPETERQSHYFLARLSRQFDAVIHWDSTRAVTPLP